MKHFSCSSSSCSCADVRSFMYEMCEPTETVVVPTKLNIQMKLVPVLISVWSQVRIGNEASSDRCTKHLWVAHFH